MQISTFLYISSLLCKVKDVLRSSSEDKAIKASNNNKTLTETK